MNILVTGAKGFIGRNLCEALKSIRDGKDKRSKYAALQPLIIFEYDRNSDLEALNEYCKKADFVFHLAGINRPQDNEEFAQGNVCFTSTLLSMLENCQNKCPVMLASSSQASLTGRFVDSEYGKSKLASEKIVRDYSIRTGAPALIYRFPNVYGKWCKPNYNSAIATFCYNIANDFPIQVNDRATELELLYIDDLVTSLLNAAICDYSEYTGSDTFCSAEPVDKITLGEIVDLLYKFKKGRKESEIPFLENGFEKKLCSTYQSYLPPEHLSYELDTKTDHRGSFTELLKSPDRGQVSVNVTLPGQVKGNHWHNTKWEKFIAVSGRGVINQRQIGLDSEGHPYPVVQYEIDAAYPTVVETPPGYTHNIINTSNEDNLVAIVWCNEIFDPDNPDTYFEEV